MHEKVIDLNELEDCMKNEINNLYEKNSILKN